MLVQSSPPQLTLLLILTPTKLCKNACSVSLVRKQRLTAIGLFIVCFYLPVPLQAGVPQQQSTYPVKGLVTDAKGVPLPGVTVRYGITGGVTDNGGRFLTRLPEERGRLTFRVWAIRR